MPAKGMRPLAFCKGSQVGQGFARPKEGQAREDYHVVDVRIHLPLLKGCQQGISLGLAKKLIARYNWPVRLEESGCQGAVSVTWVLK